MITAGLNTYFIYGDYLDLEREWRGVGAGLSSVESRERRRPRECDREWGRDEDGGLCSRSEAGRLGDLVKSISIRSPLLPVQELRLNRLAIDIMAFIPFISNNTARADNVKGSAGIFAVLL